MKRLPILAIIAVALIGCSGSGGTDIAGTIDYSGNLLIDADKWQIVEEHWVSEDLVTVRLDELSMDDYAAIGELAVDVTDQGYRLHILPAPNGWNPSFIDPIGTDWAPCLLHMVNYIIVPDDHLIVLEFDAWTMDASDKACALVDSCVAQVLATGWEFKIIPDERGGTLGYEAWEYSWAW